jgi:succinoglycan biosynthesis protein ExoA
MSLIDIIIGVRNEEKHLERCLTSLQNQNVTDIQIFVIDGQSEDRTRDIVLEKMKEDSRIKLFDNPNIVISSARNIGIKSSKAEYLAYLDGHCYVNPDWLEKLLESFQYYEKKCKLGGVGSTYALPADDTTFGKVIASALNTPFGGFGTAYTQDEKFEVVDTVAFALYKKSVLNKEELLYDETMTQCEDTDFNYQLVKKGYTLLKHHKAFVYQYRRSNPSEFFNQMIMYGEGRQIFITKHPETLKAYQLLPVMVIFYVMVLLISIVLFWAGNMNPIIITVILVPFALYIFLCLFYTLKIYLKLQSRGALYSLLVFPSVHLGYGWGFLKSILKKKSLQCFELSLLRFD